MSTLPKSRSTLKVVALTLLSVLTLLTAGPVYAQELPRGGAMAIIAAMGMFFLVFAIACYIYTSLALQTIAKKTNTENPWLAWIPIVNVILMLNIAKKRIWWIILCFIPLVNIVIIILIWMAIAEARNKPSWWGILLIVPVVNLIVPGYLAWSD